MIEDDEDEDEDDDVPRDISSLQKSKTHHPSSPLPKKHTPERASLSLSLCSLFALCSLSKKKSNSLAFLCVSEKIFLSLASFSPFLVLQKKSLSFCSLVFVCDFYSAIRRSFWLVFAAY